MTITTSLLALLAIVVPFALWLWKRKITRDETPAAKRDEIHRALAVGDTARINLLLDDAVRAHPPRPGLRDESPGDPGRQDGNPT